MSQLNDDEIANILTFSLNTWGNDGDTIRSDDVAEVRAATERPEGEAN